MFQSRRPGVGVRDLASFLFDKTTEGFQSRRPGVGVRD